MERYTIYCTPEQTEKAFDLGAPIKTISYDPPVPPPTGWAIYKHNCCKPPTAEQVIGFMQEQKDLQSFRIVHYPNCNKWGYSIIIGMHSINVCLSGDDDMLYSSRKEATLAAIDAALEYLTNNKK